MNSDRNRNTPTNYWPSTIILLPDGKKVYVRPPTPAEVIEALDLLTKKEG